MTTQQQRDPRIPDSPGLTLPNFIGIGAPKAGTTWLTKCLSEHPDVYMAPIKETEFFKFDNCLSRLDEYARHFIRANRERAIGEFTVRYLSMDKVPERIAAAIPNAKILVSLRNPVEQVESWYWHLKKQNQFATSGGQGDICLEEAIERFADMLLVPAFYHRHLQNWLRHFDRRQIHIVFYDDICAAPARVLGDLFRFLEVDVSFDPPSASSRDASVRRGTSPRNRVAGALHQATYRTLNRLYAPLKRTLGTASAAAWKDRLRVRELLEKLFHKPGYPAMRDATRSRLADIYASDIEVLSELVDRDLSKWLQSQ